MNIFDLQNESLGGKEDAFLPTRAMMFPYPAEPAFGSTVAENFVQSVKENDDVELDYSIESIHFIDIFLEDFKNEGLSVDDFAETIFKAGYYVGEIMVRHSFGMWVKQEEAELPAGIKMMPIVIKLPNKHICDPIVKRLKDSAMEI
ncbi:hypothetical protein, partial [uncultured Cytophaga sp.]|uniref:hypothetical protein n=1 Tax=uncultured Cytophaga sp. TaxID=160238 RepID=UPI002636B875